MPYYDDFCTSLGDNARRPGDVLLFLALLHVLIDNQPITRSRGVNMYAALQRGSCCSNVKPL